MLSNNSIGDSSPTASAATAVAATQDRLAKVKRYLMDDLGIDLSIGRLDIDVLRHVLNSTLDLLALGRLVVDDGFDWHGLGYTPCP